MTKTATAEKTREQLESEAAAAEQRAAAIREQMWLADEAERQRRHDAQLEWDRRLVASITPAQLDTDVDQARATLAAALEDNPMVHALADYLTALRRRSHMLLQHDSAMARLGEPTPQRGSIKTEVTGIEVAELIAAAMARIATERVASEVTDLEEQREQAGDQR